MFKGKNVDGSFEKLRQLILINDFQQCLSHELPTHLSDKKLDSVDEAADSYTLTHTRNFYEMKNTRPNYNMKVTARSVTRPLFPPQTKFDLGPFHNMPRKDSSITCAFCKRSEHIISNCFKLKRKQETEGSPYPYAFNKKYTKEWVFASSKTPTKQEPKPNPLLENYKPFFWRDGLLSMLGGRPYRYKPTKWK